MDTRSFSRRNFLKTSALAAGSTIAVPHILSSCAKRANSNIHIAHVGVGSMGFVAIKNWFMPTTGALNIASCDPFEKRRKIGAAFMKKGYRDKNINTPEIQDYNNFEDILRRKDIDAINITTPDHWHVPIAIKAARAGKHIFVAKPLGLSYNNFLMLEKEVKKAGVTFHYETQQRASTHIKIATNLIKAGKIGKIGKVDVWAPGRGGSLDNPMATEMDIPEGFDYDIWSGPAKLHPYNKDRVSNRGAWFINDYSIGWLAGWGAHPLDVMTMGIADQMRGSYTCEGNGTLWQGGGMFNTVYSWDLKYKYSNGLELNFLSGDKASEQGVLKYRKISEGNGTTFYGENG